MESLWECLYPPRRFFSRTPILSGNTGEGDKEFLVPKDTNESKLFLTVCVREGVCTSLCLHTQARFRTINN